MKTAQEESFRLQYSKFLHMHPFLFSYEERSELRAIFSQYQSAYTSENQTYYVSISNKIKVAGILIEIET